MERYEIRDIALAPSGHTKIEWFRHNMPLLAGLEEEFRIEKPFQGLRISLSVHLEAKTAYLCLVLAAGGAQMAVTGSNSLSTQDDVAAALVEDGLSVFAIHGATPEEYAHHIEMCLSHKPHIIIDDGGDLVSMLHKERPDLAENVLGGCEETTTGVIRLKAMEKEGVLKFPMVAVNDADCKHLFDNRYGTGQSVWDSIMRNTNLIVASKTVVVVGYGWCSRGIAMRAAALGARVIVTEIDPVKAIEARADELYAMREKMWADAKLDMREFERVALLGAVDRRWMDHIDAMTELRDGIGLRAYGQKNPIIEYKREGYDMFEEMVHLIQEDTLRRLYFTVLARPVERKQVAQPTSASHGEEEKKAPVRKKTDKKVGPNDPCACGSGKKYKKCCGRGE